MKRKIDPFDYAAEILSALKTGVLLTTKNGDKQDSMAISWGMLGIEWNKPIFTVFVRENRFTKEQLDRSGEFTVNIPIGDFDRRIIGFCGTRSGRDTDKAAVLGLSLEEPELVAAPGIRELPLTLECRVIYSQKQDRNAIGSGDRARFYPEDVPGSNPGENRDYHTAYYGRIVSAYIIC